MSLKTAVEEKLKQIDAKIDWHKEQIDLLRDAKKYWQKLVHDVDSILPDGKT
jgi:hypothetical protein